MSPSWDSGCFDARRDEPRRALPVVPVAFAAAARVRTDAVDRAAVLGEAEVPFRVLAGDCSLVEDFDLDGALLLTVSTIPLSD